MHRLTPFLTAAALAVAGFVQAADLTVAPGQTYVVGPAQSDLRLDHLALGDNARITFAPGVSSWRVYARQATIGQNVVIDGRGAAGGLGAAGAERSGRAKSCDEGRAGGSGGAGVGGGNGVGMSLWWGVETLGSLTIQADGGAGGNGGAGGRGQDGGPANFCEGGRGGAGGIGGAGGAGGKGGDVTLAYFAGAKAASYGERIRISTRGGTPGNPGTGGAGGSGNDGKFQRSPGGSDRWFRGGEPGLAGTAGAVGAPGAQGLAQVDIAAANTGPAWRDEISTAQAAPAVAVLQQQVQALQQATTAVAPSGQSQSIPDLVKRLQDRIDDLEERVRQLEKH
jgi:hypothetical protein